MKWTSLLSQERINNNTKAKDPDSDLEYGRGPYTRDIGKIIFSSEFRQLQNKTQVHPLSYKNNVRTRLTHSLEVATVGRSIAYKVANTCILTKENIQEDPNLAKFHPNDIGDIVYAACLAHDIGNTPFGHSGERAMQKYIEHNLHAIFPESENSYPRWIEDLKNFDGNQQGFRMLTYLMNNKEVGGLNLTFSTIGSSVKYPKTSKAKDSSKRYKKHGVLASEEDTFITIAKALGLKEIEKGALYARHPLVYITEAADDICYSIADLDDGYNEDIISKEDFIESIMPIVQNQGYKSTDSLSKLKGGAIHALITECAKAFKENYKDIINGNLISPLLENTKFSKDIKHCKTLAKNKIFKSKKKILQEIKGASAIVTIMSAFQDAILYRLQNQNENPTSGELLIKSLFNIDIAEEINNSNKKEESEILGLLFFMLSDFISQLNDYQLIDVANHLQDLNNPSLPNNF